MSTCTLYRIPGLRLPRFNEILRMKTRQRRFASGKVGRFSPGRAEEAKRVRAHVEAWALETGLANLVPLEKARIELTIFGPYAADGDGIYTKDLIDALVARRLARSKKSPLYRERRWGFIVDDSPAVVGEIEVKICRQNDLYEIYVAITDDHA